MAPLLVVDKRRTKPGRPRRADRALFNGVIWLLRPGAQGKEMPLTAGKGVPLAGIVSEAQRTERR